MKVDKLRMSECRLERRPRPVCRIRSRLRSGVQRSRLRTRACYEASIGASAHRYYATGHSIITSQSCSHHTALACLVDRRLAQRRRAHSRPLHIDHPGSAYLRIAAWLGCQMGLVRSRQDAAYTYVTRHGCVAQGPVRASTTEHRLNLLDFLVLCLAAPHITPS